MAVQIETIYQGELRCQATHGPSGNTLITDAPADNHGKGEAFSPTDLVATALATCILTTIGIVAGRHNWNVTGMTAQVTKEMVAAPVRRIGKLTVVITVPAAQAAALSDEDRQRIENTARTCPVHKSLHPDVELPIVFQWGA